MVIESTFESCSPSKACLHSSPQGRQTPPCFIDVRLSVVLVREVLSTARTHIGTVPGSRDAQGLSKGASLRPGVGRKAVGTKGA